MNEKIEPSVEDKAAHTFSTLIPIWKKLSDSLSKKGLIRVIDAVMEFPLQDKYPKFQNGKEFEAFKIASTILDCKTVMISSFVEEKMKEQKLEVKSSLLNEDKKKELEIINKEDQILNEEF